MSRCLNIGRSLEAEKGIEYAGIYCKFPCGSCVNCRRNQQRKWVARMALEERTHRESSWVTLTYDEDNLPADSCVRKEHLRRFLKTLGRKEIWPRYFAVGEYGNRTGRPHYHVLLFGRHPGFVYRRGKLFDPGIESAWPFGGTYTESFSTSRKPLGRIMYLASYAAKKWTKETPDGRSPEFAHMSKRPFIGAAALDQLETACYQLPHIPRTIRIGGRLWPLDRLLRDKLSRRTGLAHAPPESTESLTIAEQSAKNRKQQKRKRYAQARSAF